MPSTSKGSEVAQMSGVPAARPPVKRQYGSRKSSSSSSTPSSRASTSSISSSSRFRQSLATSSDWSDLLSSEPADGSSSSTLSLPSLDAPSTGDTPPTSPEPISRAAKLTGDQSAPGLAATRERRSPKQDSARTGKGDLRSFFSKVSPRKRARKQMNTLDSDEEERGSGTKRRAVTLPGRKTTTSAQQGNAYGKGNTKSTSAKPKLEQLFLDPYETAGHSTLSCAVCSLSYSRTPEDMELHTKHHKRVVGGCDWVANDQAVKGVPTLDEGLEWGENEGGRVVMVDANAEGAVGRRVKDILSTIDTELSSTELGPSQLVECKLFLFITSQRKVIAAAVVQRIDKAYEVVVAPSALFSDSTHPSSSPTSTHDPSLLRFGEEEGAIFCSPTPVPTLLGVHRIWTSSTHRRNNLASRLLDHVAASFIYGCPISHERRAADVAFSQPTGKGKALAKAWTGSAKFRVFVE